MILLSCKLCVSSGWFRPHLEPLVLIEGETFQKSITWSFLQAPNEGETLQKNTPLVKRQHNQFWNSKSYCWLHKLRNSWKSQFWIRRNVRNLTKSRNMDMSSMSQKLQVRAKPSGTTPVFVKRQHDQFSKFRSFCWLHRLRNTQRKTHGKYAGSIYGIYKEYIRNIHRTQRRRQQRRRLCVFCFCSFSIYWIFMDIPYILLYIPYIYIYI